jgi:Carboxypeptidase regulatory-like domain
VRSHPSIPLLSVYFAFAAHALCPKPSAASQSPANGFPVAGVVLQHGSNQPLKHVQVSLISVEQRDRQRSRVTLENGQFAFSGIPAGKYSLVAQLHGFVQAYRDNEDYSTAIVVGPSLDSEHIAFFLDAPAAISGTVLDQEGEPIRDAQVFLFHRGVVSGRHRTMMQAQANADSSGAFRFGQLRPGTYLLAVSARPWYAVTSPFKVQLENSSQNANPSELDVAYPVTYYPDSLDPAAASPITLSEGGTADISITLRAVPAVRVEANTLSQHSLNFSISAVGPGNVLLPINAVQFGEENRRGILGLAPGHYVLTLQRFEQGSAGSSMTKTIDLSANSTLDLTELPKMSVSGQVRVEGAERPKELGVWLVDVNSGQGRGGSARPDGSFKFDQLGISPGPYEIRLGNDLYVKSIVVSGADYSSGILNVTEGATIQISIVAAKGLTRVNGIAMNDGKPVPGAMVLLLPQDSTHGRYIPRDQSDSDGTFTLYSAPPGRYALIAIDDGRDLAYRNASVIRPYLEQAQIIDLPLPSGARVQVNVQSRRP